jgi:hypothetical protein
LAKEMIRERVSTKGFVRELEPEEDLQAMELTMDSIGMVNELSVKRYLDAQTVWEKRFKETLRTVAKQRKRHIDAADVEDTSRFTKLKATVLSKDKDNEERNKIINSANWSWAWVVAGDENPPPSSIVARRDTAEARRLSKIADDAVEEKESRISGNNLWAMIVNALTSGPEHTVPKSPEGSKSPTSFTTEPPSPPRSIFRSSGLRSTSSLATSISGDIVRIRRPSFGSLRIGRGRYLDVNGELMSQRQSIVPELPPALPSVGGLGRDDGFAKGALEGILEVRASSEEVHAPTSTVADAKTNGTTNGTNGPPKLAVPNGHAANGHSPGVFVSIKRSGGSTTPVKRKAIPAQLFEEAGIDPAQSPYASKESLTKHSNSSHPKLPKKESTSALSTKSSPGSPSQGTSGKDVIPPVPPITVNDGEPRLDANDASKQPEAAAVPTAA